MIERKALNCHRAGRSGRAEGGRHRRSFVLARAGMLLVASALVFSVLATASASAAITHSFLASFSEGPTGTRLVEPGVVAVDHATDRCSWAMRAMKWSMCTPWPARIRRSSGAKVKRRSNRRVWEWTQRTATWMWLMRPNMLCWRTPRMGVVAPLPCGGLALDSGRGVR